VGKLFVRRQGLQESGGEPYADGFEEFEKGRADGVAVRQEPIRRECGCFSTNPLALT
jgi:hypothetical protein